MAGQPKKQERREFLRFDYTQPVKYNTVNIFCGGRRNHTFERVFAYQLRVTQNWIAIATTARRTNNHASSFFNFKAGDFSGAIKLFELTVIMFDLGADRLP